MHFVRSFGVDGKSTEALSRTGLWITCELLVEAGTGYKPLVVT
ncbi:MAG: hypothetical protein QM784_11835 [Polyangiaceae bacterium]